MDRRRVTRSIVPNMLTLVNLFSGFSAIIYASKGEILNAALFVLVASVFDMLDGVFARLFNATSEFGAELDSLCDAVSFGVAPSFMLYMVYFQEIGDMGIIIASLPALAGVVRLARFNIRLTSFDDKDSFFGLPIPSSALTIISYLVFIHNDDYLPQEYKPVSIIAVTLITSLGMVSTIRFDNIPRPTLHYIKRRPYAFGLFLIGIAGSIITLGELIFPFMIFYIFASSIRELVYLIKRKRMPEDEIDESEETEPNVFDL